jgi:hypothetical protein
MARMAFRLRSAVAAFALAGASARAEPTAEPTFRFVVPEGFVDALSSHGRALEPSWPLFCAGEGIVACAFSGEYEDDGSRAFAYAKLVPGAQPVGEAMLSKFARSVATGFDARDAVVHVDEQGMDAIGGHRAGRILATVTASGRTTKRWVWVVATADAMAMITYVAPAASFERWRPVFEASVRRSEGVVDAPPLMLQALTKGPGKKGLQALLWIALLALVLKVVAQASSRRRATKRRDPSR